MVVVGGSLAGLRAIETLRNEGFEGRVTLIGAETRQPYDRPPLSKKVLAGEWEPERIAVGGGRRPGLARRRRCGSVGLPPGSMWTSGSCPWTTARACPTTA